MFSGDVCFASGGLIYSTSFALTDDNVIVVNTLVHLVNITAICT